MRDESIMSDNTTHQPDGAKLRECPFCGATAKHSGETGFGNVARIVHMSNCLLNKSHDVFVIGTYEAELWNRRAPSPVEALRQAVAD